MTLDDKIRDQKLQYNINRKATKISALSPGETGEHKCLTGEDILSFNQRKIIEQAKFAYSPLGKAFERQIEKEADPVQSLDISDKNLMNDLIRGKLKENVKLQDIVKKYNLNYKSKRKKTYNFRVYSYYLLFFLKRNI